MSLSSKVSANRTKESKNTLAIQSEDPKVMNYIKLDMQISGMIDHFKKR